MSFIIVLLGLNKSVKPLKRCHTIDYEDVFRIQCMKHINAEANKSRLTRVGLSLYIMQQGVVILEQMHYHHTSTAVK